MSTSSNNVQSQYIRVLERLKDLVEENKRLKSTVESNEGETKVKIQKHTKTISDLERDLREYEARIGDLNVLLHRKGKDALRTEWEMSRMKAKIEEIELEAEEASSRWIAEIEESRKQAEERSKALQVETEEEISKQYENMMRTKLLSLEDAHKHKYIQYREELRESEEYASRFEKRTRTMTLEMQEMEVSAEHLNREIAKLRNAEHRQQHDPVTRDETNDALVDKLQRENARLDDELKHALRRIAELERQRLQKQQQQQLPPRESQSQQQKRRPRPQQQQQRSKVSSTKKVFPRLSNNTGQHRHWASSASPLTVRRTSHKKKY
eukprot:g1259.t1